MDDVLRPSLPPQRTFPWKKAISIFFLVALAAIFFFSAISKLFSVASFEWAIMDTGIPSHAVARILARLLIGFELLLGVFLLAQVSLKRLTYPTVLLFLGLMSAYLIVLMIKQGNTGDCGCFGDALPMSPLLALLKNVGMVIMVWFLMRQFDPAPYRFQGLITGVGGMAALALPFFLLPISNKPEYLNMDALYAPGHTVPAVDLRKGRHVIAFMSLTCPHCKDAARTFRKIWDKNPNLPIFFVLNGLPEQAPDFFKETKAEAIPHVLFQGVDAFVKMAGQYVPSIYYVENSKIERRVSQRQLSRASIEQWTGH